MQKIQNANQLSGRAIGAIFFTGFGALWLLLALYIKELLSAVTIAALLLGFALLLAAALTLLRRAKRWPRVPDDPAVSRTFNRVNAAQWIAVAIAATALHKLHQDVYVMNAITVITGLHMFPLARLFRYWPHHVTGAALVVWSAASLFVPIDHLQGIAALGTGLILWSSATATLALAFQDARQQADSPAC